MGKGLGLGLLLGFFGLMVGYAVHGQAPSGEYISPALLFGPRESGLLSWGVSKYFGVEERREKILLFGVGGAVLGLLLGVLAGMGQESRQGPPRPRNTFEDFQKGLVPPPTAGPPPAPATKPPPPPISPEDLRRMKSEGILEEYVTLRMLGAVEPPIGSGGGRPPLSPAGDAAPPAVPSETRVRPADSVDLCLLNMDSERLYPLRREVTTLGRGADCDIVLADEYASRKHVQFVTQPDGGVLAINLSSATAIPLSDGRKIAPGERLLLKSGDVLEIGYTRLKLVSRAPS